MISHTCSYHKYNIRRPVLCTHTYELDAGEHVIDMDMYVRGGNYKIHHATSLVTVRALSAAASSAKEEGGSCSGHTAQTLLDTYQSATYSVGCTRGSLFNLDSRFANAGPWQLSSRTGRVRITYRTRAYVRADYCYSARIDYARLEIRPKIDGHSLGAAGTVLAHAQYREEYVNGPILVDLVHDVGVGSFKLSLDGYFQGYSTNLYGNSHWSTLRVEDIPKEERKPESANLPAGCKGYPRRYLIQTHVASQSRLVNTNGGNSWLVMKDGSSQQNKLRFTVLQDKTRLRLYVKVQAYVAENRYYGSASSSMRLTPYIDNKAQGVCCDRKTVVYTFYSDYEEGAQTCSMEFSLDKGEHTFQLQHFGRGDESTVRSGSGTSVILLEELVHRTY